MANTLDALKIAGDEQRECLSVTAGYAG